MDRVEDESWRYRSESQESELDATLDGLTLRDWFAAQALAHRWPRISDADEAAERAYEIADAMLEARKR